MKKYGICLFLFLLAGGICLGIGAAAGRQHERAQTELSAQVKENGQEAATEGLPAANSRVSSTAQETAAAEEYYLVSEDGFLLVFLKDQKTICLYTHVPLMDFPEKEQERLREGIWFSSMMEVFHYLESYTS
ncbi:MAG: hypothetical protein Q4C73_07405 [Eubacteriales bacterium]|nr:hypothetical protein [Eubacteriales bacterium]